jgi:hypothetical protein
MIRWRPFEYQGKVYDLTHLHPRTVVYEQAAKGDKPSRCYTVDVVFGLHCFTRRFEEGKKPDTALIYADNREERIFDFRRYQLSRLLPEIIEGLPLRKCYHSGKGNFFSVEITEENSERVEYDIFFAASRSSKKGVINLFVQSAYVRDPQYAASRPEMKPIGFYVILFNTLNNRPIKPPPK